MKKYIFGFIITACTATTLLGCSESTSAMAGKSSAGAEQIDRSKIDLSKINQAMSSAIGVGDSNVVKYLLRSNAVDMKYDWAAKAMYEASKWAEILNKNNAGADADAVRLNAYNKLWSTLSLISKELDPVLGNVRSESFFRSQATLNTELNKHVNKDFEWTLTTAAHSINYNMNRYRKLLAPAPKKEEGKADAEDSPGPMSTSSTSSVPAAPGGAGSKK